MKYLGLLLLFVLGFALLHRLGPKKSLLEKTGFSFPIAFGLHSLIMFAVNAMGFHITHASTVMGIHLAGILAIVLSGARAFKLSRGDIKEAFREFTGNKLSLNLGWLLLVGLCGYILYVIVFKAVLWPVYIFDSVSGYDFLAKAIAREGTIDNLIFRESYPLHSVRILYPPLFPYNLGYAYLLGFGSSKIINALFYVSLALAFYTLLKKYLNHYGAALFTLLLLTVPELTAFSGLSSPNPPGAFYCSLGAICIFLWSENDDRYYFILGTLLLVFSIWLRSESVIFAAGAGLLILFKSLKTRKFMPLVIFTLACGVTLVIWQIYLKNVLGVSESQPIILQLYWDYPKLSRMMDRVWAVTFKTQYYGFVIYLFIAFLLINLRSILKEKENRKLPLMILSAWIIYLVIYYQIDTDYGENSTSWIRNGYKRGFLHFMPLFIFFIGTNKISRTFINTYLSLDK